MDWNKEFKVTPERVAAEVRRIQKEKRTYNALIDAEDFVKL